MSAVWDRTVAVLAERGRTLAAIGVATLLVPAIVRAGVQASADPNAAGPALVGGIVALAMVLVALWGQLALVAVAAGVASDGPAALRVAGARLPAAIGLAAIALLVVAILFAPVGVAMVRSGADMTQVSAGGTMTVPPAAAVFVSVYLVAFVVLALVIGARLATLWPVVLLERRGLGAFARAFRQTRGLFWRILGTALLYLVVLAVATGAARFVVGTAAALILGPGVAATLVALIAAAIVTTILSVVAVAFVTQLYLALIALRPDLR